MSKPLVSVIIPAYNSAFTLSMSIDSVLRQSYSNTEIIVVDDGSTDNTGEVLRSYGDKIIAVRKENGGVSSARNYGISRSNGEILTFLDADDLWLPTLIERHVEVLSKVGDSVPCCLCNAIIRNLNGNEHLAFDIAPIKPRYAEGIWLNVLDVLSTRCVFFNQAVAVRREAMLRVGGFDEKLWVMEDHDLALKLSLEGPWAYIADPLVSYRRYNSGGLSNSARNESLKLFDALVELHKNILSMDLQSPKIARRFEQAMKVVDRKVKIKLLCDNNVFGARVLARSNYIMRHIRGGINRRLPWSPKMVDQAI